MTLLWWSVADIQNENQRRLLLPTQRVAAASWVLQCPTEAQHGATANGVAVGSARPVSDAALPREICHWIDAII